MGYLKPKECANIMRVSTLTVLRLIESGKIPAVMIGRQRRIDSGDFARYIKAQAIGVDSDSVEAVEVSTETETEREVEASTSAQ